MVYNSLFDRVAREHPNCFNLDSPLFDHITQNFQQKRGGMFGWTISDLQDTKQNQHAISLVLEAPRLIRACLDYKIRAPNSQVEDLVQDLTQINLHIYATGKVNIASLEKVKSRLVGSNDENLMYEPINQGIDITSWRASNPKYSILTAKKIKSSFPKEDVLFIALCHGGLGAGMDVFLRHANSVKSKNNIIYPVRFSMNKLHDREPQLTEIEKEYLTQQSERRRIVVFDEDTFSGETINKATDYFANLLKRKDVLPLTNLNRTSTLD